MKRPAAARGATWAVAVAIVLLSWALIALYLKARAYDENSLVEQAALLRHIKQLDAQWESDALKSRVGLNNSYDPLTAPMAELRQLRRQLSDVTPAWSSSESRAALAHAGLALQQTMDDKEQLIEHFKSHNAVMRNSLTFLPTAADDLRQASRQAGDSAAKRQRLNDASNDVLLATLLYSLSASDERAADIKAALERLMLFKPTASPDLGEGLGIFAAHVETVLHECRLVAELLAKLTAVPVAARVDEIQSLLNTEQALAAQQSRRYRQYLFWFAAALIGSLVYAALLVARSHALVRSINKALVEANEGLEQKVQARTSELLAANENLQVVNHQLTDTTRQLVQSEKMASVGALAAGVAHELNTPIGYVSSNLRALSDYTDQMLTLLECYEAAETLLCAVEPETLQRLAQAKKEIDLPYLRQDLPELIWESRSGLERVRKIVADLRAFAQLDAVGSQPCDLHEGLNQTINLLGQHLGDKTELVRSFGSLPLVECQPSEINQVFMNLLLNAAQAVHEHGRIQVVTGTEGGGVWVQVEDNGGGIDAAHLPRIFDPFFTTKAVGTGTGLGLFVSHAIVKKHGGRIEVDSQTGQGARFRVWLPASQDLPEAAHRAQGHHHA